MTSMSKMEEQGKINKGKKLDKKIKKKEGDKRENTKIFLNNGRN